MSARRREMPALTALLESPRLPRWLALLAMAPAAPTLFIGLHLDDYMQRYCGLKLPGSEEICPSYLSFFTVIPGDPHLTHALIEQGFAPYWTYDKLLIAFLRPIATLTHRLDYLLWPSSPLLMHAQSLLWFGGAVFVAPLLYRGIMGVGVASGGAAFAFAVDHVHGMPVGWISNRNSLIGALLGTVALLAYDRGRRRGSMTMHLIGAPCLLLGLLGGEIALGAWGYLLSHAIALDRGPVRARLLALLPYALITIAWRAAYDALGFGALGSGLYIDPPHEPLLFLSVLPQRLPLLVLGLFGLPSSEAYYFVNPALARWIMGSSIALSAALAVTAAPLVRIDRVSRFWAIGMILSLLPSCAAVPHNRLLYFSSLGAMGLLSGIIQALTAGNPRLPTGPWRLVARSSVILTGGLHALVSPVLLPFAACNIRVTHSIVDRAIPSAMAA